MTLTPLPRVLKSAPALTPLPEVLKSYPDTARWVWMIMNESDIPLSQHQIAAITTATPVTVHLNQHLLARGGLLIRDRKRSFRVATPEELKKATPYAVSNDLGPQKTGENLRVALLAAGNRARFGHDPIHVFYHVKTMRGGDGKAFYGVIPEVQYAIAQTAEEAADVLEAPRSEVVEAYHMEENGQFTNVMPPFGKFSTVKFRAGQLGKEIGVPQRVLLLDNGMFTMIPEDQPVPDRATDLGVQPPAGSKLKVEAAAQARRKEIGARTATRESPTPSQALRQSLRASQVEADSPQASPKPRGRPRKTEK